MTYGGQWGGLHRMAAPLTPRQQMAQVAQAGYGSRADPAQGGPMLIRWWMILPFSRPLMLGLGSLRAIPILARN
jgi:hypothetical protein